jgi:hypothetical protein
MRRAADRWAEDHPLSKSVDLRPPLAVPRRIDFSDAEFSNSTVSFDGAVFSGGTVDFSHPYVWSRKPISLDRHAATKREASKEGRSIPCVGVPDLASLIPSLIHLRTPASIGVYRSSPSSQEDHHGSP